MKRADALKSVVHLFDDIPCCVTVGAAWVEWDSLRPSEKSFHLKTLGSGSSVGLGLALGMPHRKIGVLDGDGAVVMNVNGLLTTGRIQPKNLVHMVFDNKIYESSGSVPTATAYSTDLVTIAQGAGIKSSQRVKTVEAFRSAVENALKTDGPHFILAEVEPVGKTAPAAYGAGALRVDDVEGKYKFIRFIETLEKRKIFEDAIDVKQSFAK
jgi:thiamine pyrophosphate-dependent acetolactate synthase large subunit-like protein